MRTFAVSAWQSLRLFATGFAMGTADLVPGVSGGTIAFLAGIYEELLYSINTATGPVLRLLLRGRVVEAVRLVPWRFLLPLGFGILLALFSLATALSYLLVAYPVLLWSFFFGLVAASVVVVLRRVRHWRRNFWLVLGLSAVAAYVLVGLVPVETPNTLLFVFFSGMIAICAMLLPGISGSFILVLLGKYQQILAAVAEREWALLAVFAAGCALGIALFARVLGWLFARYHDLAVVVLSGLMIGSLRKVWPWQVEATGSAATYNVLPVLDASAASALAVCLVAAGFVLLLDRKKVLREHQEDVAPLR